MPRRARSLLGSYVYHVLNRANGRLRLFKKDGDFAAFQRVEPSEPELISICHVPGRLAEIPNHEVIVRHCRGLQNSPSAE